MLLFRVKLAATKIRKKKERKKKAYKDTSTFFHQSCAPYGRHIIYFGSLESKMQLFFSNFSAFPQRRH